MAQRYGSLISQALGHAPTLKTQTRTGLVQDTCRVKNGREVT